MSKNLYFDTKSIFLFFIFFKFIAIKNCSRSAVCCRSQFDTNDTHCRTQFDAVQQKKGEEQNKVVKGNKKEKKLWGGFIVY